MEIFKIEGRIVQPTIEILLISPFKEIWENDKSKNKDEALKDFAYIEFMCSPKRSNPYFGYDENVKEEKIKQEIYKDVKYKISPLVIKAVDKYKEFLEDASLTMSYFMSAKCAAEKIKKFFNTFDINERTKNDTPVYKPKEITSAIIDTELTLQKLDNMQKKVEQELFETTKTRNNKEINHFEE